MNTQRFPCPLCGKLLSEADYFRITGRWQKLEELETKFRRTLRSEVDRARRTERQRVSEEMIVKDRKLVVLTGRLKRLKAQSERGLTPQLEGLLYEKELARQLSQRFRQDRVIPAGKCGDVIHRVYLNGARVGTIVYECKKVAKLQRAHIEQARLATIQRGADFSIVVTTARVENTFGFWVDKDVLVIHPAAALVLAGWLRATLIELAKARLPRTARERILSEVMSFLGGPEFKNPIQDLIRRSEDLGKQLREEVRTHQHGWSKRFNHYRAMWLDARAVAQKVANLVNDHTFKRMPAGPTVDVPKAYPVDKAALLLRK